MTAHGYSQNETGVRPVLGHTRLLSIVELGGHAVGLMHLGSWLGRDYFRGGDPKRLHGIHRCGVILL